MRNSILFIFFLISSCKFFEPVSLDEQQAVNQKLVLGKIPAVDVMTRNNGLIDSFDEALWKSDTNLVVVTDWLGKLRVRSDSAGPGREYIYRDFNPLSFENSRFLQLQTETEEERIPLLQAELVDRNGRTVAAVGRVTLEETGKKLTYRFEFPPSYFEGNRNKFEHTQVVELRLYIHAAGDSYSGVIFLNELRALRNP